MVEKIKRAPRPSRKRRWTQRRIALWSLYVLTATFFVGYIMVPLYLDRSKSGGAQAGNTVNGATSSAIMQGGSVGNVTVNNYQPTPSPSPTPSPAAGPAAGTVSRAGSMSVPAPTSPPLSTTPPAEQPARHRP